MTSTGQPPASAGGLPPDQPSLFDAAATAKADGMARAQAHAGPEWEALAWEALSAYWASHAEFFVDDFWAETGLPPGPSARALGPLIQRGALRGHIAKTDRARPSVRSNLSPKPVWRSLVYGGPDA